MITVARHCLIIVQLGSLDSSRDFARGFGMDFVSYSHLILLISGQTIEVTVANKFSWEEKKRKKAPRLEQQGFHFGSRTWRPGPSSLVILDALLQHESRIDTGLQKRS